MQNGNAQPRRTVAVLFGGRSLEHDVSIVSGLQVLHAIDPEQFTAIPIYIDPRGRWWTGDALWHRDAFGSQGPHTAQLNEVSLSQTFGESVLTFGDQAGQSRPGLRIDVFLPILHGTYGEDGCIQGLLELAGCAYVGCGVGAAAVGMNKRFSKIMAAHMGIPVVPWQSVPRQVLDGDESWPGRISAEVEAAFPWPVIVKPCNLGSSAGVSVAHASADLTAGILKVFEFDTEALIEPFIKNRLELNVAVLGVDPPIASVTEMPVTIKESPLSFGDKYKRAGRKSLRSSEGMASAVRVLDPTDLPPSMRATAQEYAVRVFSALGCEGIARIDFLIDTDRDQLYFNEINTLPGSLSYYLFAAAPRYWLITELLTKLIDRAERANAIRKRLRREPTQELRLFG